MRLGFLSLVCFLIQDCFFYSLVFDPVQKTLLADQGEIRVGSKYQAEIPDKLAEGEPERRREKRKRRYRRMRDDPVCWFYPPQEKRTRGFRRSWRPSFGTPTTS